jgi:hypothetical protein
LLPYGDEPHWNGSNVGRELVHTTGPALIA